jgi:hypothetical protein
MNLGQIARWSTLRPGCDSRARQVVALTSKSVDDGGPRHFARKQVVIARLKSATLDVTTVRAEVIW